MMNNFLKPDVKGFFDPTTASWSYVVYGENHENKNCAIIDPILDYNLHSSTVHTHSADRIVEFINIKGLTVQWILETHIHADHLTAAAYLKEKLGGKTALSKHVLKELEAWEAVFHNESDTPTDGSQFDYLFSDDELFWIGPFEAKIIHTPGHTSADTSYIVGDAVFVGDTMLSPDVGTGRCDLPNGSAEKSYDSCKKLLSFPDDYRMYVGHDYPPNNARSPRCMTLIEEQRQQNIRVREEITKEQYVEKRNADDKGKDVPRLLFPAVQVNLRGGTFGQNKEGVRYIKLPVTIL